MLEMNVIHVSKTGPHIFCVQCIESCEGIFDQSLTMCVWVFLYNCYDDGECRINNITMRTNSKLACNQLGSNDIIICFSYVNVTCLIPTNLLLHQLIYENHFVPTLD